MYIRMDAAQADQYSGLGLENEYVIESGKFVLPLAEDAPTDPIQLAVWKPFAVVVAHSPMRTRRFTYNAKKSRTPPVIPYAGDSGAYTFLGGSVRIPHPAVQTDGSFTWEADTTFFFAEGCASDSTTGFVIGNSLDAFVSQVGNVNYSYAGDAPANVRLGGVGPKAGWNLAKTIDLGNGLWSYTEPSYFPAQLFSADLLGGPVAYPEVTGFSFNPFQG